MLKRIGEVAKMLSTSTRTIRHYEQVGLLKPHSIEDNGYRMYSDDEIMLLDQILALVRLGFTLHQEKTVLARSQGGDAISREQIHSLVKWQATAIRAQMENLLETEKMLHDLDIALQLNTGEPLRFVSSISQVIGRNTKLRQQWHDRWGFDAWAEHYDQPKQTSDEGYDPHRTYGEVLELVASLVPAGCDVLDIGIGTGNLAAKLDAKSGRITGVDSSEVMLRKAREKLPQATLLPGHFLALPLSDASVDAVVSTYALHHLTETEKELAVAEMFRVLRPGGRIVIGDNMFWDEATRQEERMRLSTVGRLDDLAAIDDEYLGNVTNLISWYRVHGMQAAYRQTDRYTWVVGTNG